MALEDLRDELSEEVASILDSSFSIDITETDFVPHSGDAAITFPNLDAGTQGAKLIQTCVLYIDMRGSTVLSFAHKAPTVAKLYSAFVRAMTRTARHYRGHVRGIIGDRVMVLFDTEDCFNNAVSCGVAMNTVSQYIINKHFKANEVKFGIGIDYGRMLATKTGIRKHGSEQANYRNLVWLGRPANVASKLTDAANKPEESVTIPNVRVAYRGQPPLGGLLGANLSAPFGLNSNPLSSLVEPPSYGALSSFFQPTPLSNALQQAIGATPQTVGEWQWRDESFESFLSQVEVDYSQSRMVHKRADFASFYLSSETKNVREATPAILITAAVWHGFRKAKPNSKIVQQPLFKKVDVQVSGYAGDVFGGDVIFPQLK
ncbi:adenylate cyclase [Bradyrhizobium sp. S3.2.6]|uniref:adenylate/guanylate cyclase domain-containing protein n=1 Tax=Bradyrhizobium sp. S3.2.6 TaxID=3156428 RepID=UPI0033910134